MIRIALHFLFWIASALLLILYLGGSSSDYRFTIIFVSLLLPTAILTSYSFNYYLLPSLLFKKRYLPFAIYSLAIVVLSLHLEMMVTVVVFMNLADYSYENMAPMAANSLSMAVGMYFIVFLSIILYLARRWARPLPTATHEKVFLHVRSDRKMMQLDTKEILYVESMDNYVKIHTINGVIITKEKISKLEVRLPEQFIRVHRSFLVNRYHVDSFTKEKLVIGEIEIPISRTYKDSLFANLEALAKG
jgi:hypothetical protein